MNTSSSTDNDDVDTSMELDDLSSIDDSDQFELMAYCESLPNQVTFTHSLEEALNTIREGGMYYLLIISISESNNYICFFLVDDYMLN